MSTSTEIAVRPASLPEKMAYAKALAQSGMLPEQYRHQPANLLWAVEYGETIGITPMAAITGVHMIEGKPTASAALISGLVRRAGHRLRSGYDAATRTGWAEIVRFDDPEFTFRCEWNLARAVEAELCTIDRDGNPVAKDSKGRSKPWKKFYPSMTKARSITEVARDACEEVLFGLHYTPEELGAETDDEGNLIDARASWSRPDNGPVADQWQAPAPAPQAAAVVDEIEEVEVVGEPQQADERSAPKATQPMKSKLHALLMRKRGLGRDRDTVHAAVGLMVDRQIGSTNDLSYAETQKVIDLLEAEPDFVNEPMPEGTSEPSGLTAADPEAEEALVADLRMFIDNATGIGQLDEVAATIKEEVERGAVGSVQRVGLINRWLDRKKQLDAQDAGHVQLAGVAS